jgi:hypothetical protein
MVVTVADHGDPVGQVGNHLGLEVIETVGREQGGHRRPVERAGALTPRDDYPARQDLTNEDADRSIARLTRRVDGKASLGEAVCKERALRRRTGPVDAFDHDEVAVDHEPSFGLPNLKVAPNCP